MNMIRQVSSNTQAANLEPVEVPHKNTSFGGRCKCMEEEGDSCCFHNSSASADKKSTSLADSMRDGAVKVYYVTRDGVIGTTEFVTTFARSLLDGTLNFVKTEGPRIITRVGSIE